MITANLFHRDAPVSFDVRFHEETDGNKPVLFIRQGNVSLSVDLPGEALDTLIRRLGVAKAAGGAA